MMIMMMGYLVSSFTDELGTGVVVLVDSVTESHQHLLPCLHVLDELWHIFDGSNLLQHFQHSLHPPMNKKEQNKEKKRKGKEGTSLAPPWRGP